MDKRIIQVPMDVDLITALDAISKNIGAPRAEVIRKACKAYLKRLEDERLDREYVEGYRRIPETLEEEQWADAGMVYLGELLKKDEW